MMLAAPGKSLPPLGKTSLSIYLSVTLITDNSTTWGADLTSP
jgi:hypothetical protein